MLKHVDTSLDFLQIIVSVQPANTQLILTTLTDMKQNYITNCVCACD